ncbi:transposase [Halovulum sp. GXIMD14793]
MRKYDVSKKDTGIMNTQTLGALSSDQKIDKVFHAFGYSIPVGKDGRRLWPTKFKREMAQRMRSGTLSIGDVQKTCQISDKTAYAWRKGPKQRNSAKRQKVQERAPVFAEIKVQHDVPVKQTEMSHIVFKRAGCELLLPSDYPVAGLVGLIRAFESGS